MKKAIKITIILFLIVIIGFVGYSTFINYMKSYSVAKDKQNILSQIEKINQESQKLEELKAIINDPDYKNKEVKQKLDVKDKGEIVINLSPASIVENMSDEELIRVLKDPNQEEIKVSLTNREKWLAFFFDKNKL